MGNPGEKANEYKREQIEQRNYLENSSKKFSVGNFSESLRLRATIQANL